MLEMSPGMGMDKNILSVNDLKSHKDQIHYWSPTVFIQSLLKDRFDAKLLNPESKAEECLADLICYGSNEVSVVNLTFVNKMFTCFVYRFDQY